VVLRVPRVRVARQPPQVPFSANNGFLPGQIDIAFQLIKLMHRLGIVKSYIDAKPLFEKECLALSGGEALIVGE